MNTTISPTPRQSALVARVQPTVKDFMDAAFAPSTKRVYGYCERQYEAWCKTRGHRPWPSTRSIAMEFGTYLAETPTRRRTVRAANTIRIAMQAVWHRHIREGWEVPAPSSAVRAFCRGLRKGRREKRHNAIKGPEVATVLKGLGDGPKDVRDHALISTLYAGGMSYRTLSTLRMETTWFTSEGTVLLRTGDRYRPEIELTRGEHPDTCPVRSLRRLIQRMGRKRGPLFTGTQRSTKTALLRTSVNRIIRQRFAGLHRKGICAFAMRTGCATELSKGEFGAVKAMKFLGYKSVRSYERYMSVLGEDHVQSAARRRMRRQQRRKVK